MNEELEELKRSREVLKLFKELKEEYERLEVWERPSFYLLFRLATNKEFLKREDAVDIFLKIINTKQHSTGFILNNLIRVAKNPKIIKDKNYLMYLDLILGLVKLDSERQFLPLGVLETTLDNPSFLKREDALNAAFTISKIKLATYNCGILKDFIKIINNSKLLKNENYIKYLDIICNIESTERFNIIADLILSSDFVENEKNGADIIYKLSKATKKDNYRFKYCSSIYSIKNQIKEEHFDYILEKIIKCNTYMSGRLIYDFVKKYDNLEIPKYFDIIDYFLKEELPWLEEIKFTKKTFDEFFDFFVKREDIVEILDLFLVVEYRYVRSSLCNTIFHDINNFTRDTVLLEEKHKNGISHPFSEHYLKFIKLILYSQKDLIWNDEYSNNQKKGYKINSVYNMVMLGLEPELYNYDNWYKMLQIVSRDKRNTNDRTYNMVSSLLNKIKQNYTKILL